MKLSPQDLDAAINADLDSQEDAIDRMVLGCVPTSPAPTLPLDVSLPPEQQGRYRKSHKRRHGPMPNLDHLER
jgi:hypothetical protein